MDKPSEEQIKRFWEKLADQVEMFNEGKHYHFRFGDEWYDGKQTSFASGIPIIDLNNLFKYAVPKLQHATVIKYKQHVGGKYQARAQMLAGREYITGDYEDPALALFWAIYKVIEDENSKS